MKIALIPPISLLSWTAMTDYQLMLPHLVTDLVYDECYSLLCDDPKQYVILDNGVAEDKASNVAHLLELIDGYSPDEIVLPDVIGDGKATLKASQQMSRRLAGDDINRMYVAQGKTVEEFVHNALDGRASLDCDAIGIPRHALETCGDIEARIKIATKLQDIGGWNTAIHFLGSSPLWSHEAQYLADAQIVDQTWIRGMDTSLPFNCAYYGRPIADGVARPASYFSAKAKAFDGWTAANVRELLEITRCESGKPTTGPAGRR